MIKHRYSQKVIIRKDAIKKDGTAAVCLQVFINGKRKVLPLGFSSRVEDFSTSLQQIKIEKPKKMATARKEKLLELENSYNAIIHLKVARAKSIFANAIMMDVTLTTKEFAKQFRDETLQKDFIRFVKDSIGKEIGAKESGTIAQYRQMLAHLSSFRKTLLFSEINFELVDEFDKFLKRKKLSTNTIAKHHKNFKKFINLAIRKKVPVENPYLNFKIKKSRTLRTFLELEEVESLLQMYRSRGFAKHLQEQLRAFLFMCFTGLRDSDVRELTVDNLGTHEIIFTPKKTQYSLQLHKVPLSVVALELLNDVPVQSGKLFSLPVTQEFNDQLKVIGRFANLKKKLTTKVARHTFATTFLTLGGKVETLQQILAHTDITTTMVYVHITPQRRREEISNFNQFAINSEAGHRKEG